MIPLGPVVARSRIQADRATVWAYLVSAARRALWWPELTMTAQIGGAVAEHWSEGDGDDRISRDASGEIDVVVPEHALGFRWKEAGDERSTAVLITLRTMDDGTAVTVTETGFDTLSDAASRAAASQEGWNVLLRDLTEVTEADSGQEFPEDDEVEGAPDSERSDEVSEVDEEIEASPEAEAEAEGEAESDDLEEANTAPISVERPRTSVAEPAIAHDTEPQSEQTPKSEQAPDLGFDDLIRGRR